MDSNGRIYNVADEADALRRGLTMINRPLTDAERARGYIRFCDPCGCGSGKKFKRCCYGKTTTDGDTVRDWCAANITMQKGLPGAKPLEFCYWLFSVLNIHPSDDLDDLFPGSGNVAEAWDMWQRQRRLFA